MNHILITGAGSGLGRALAQSWLDRGAKDLAILDIDAHRVEETCSLLNQQGAHAVGFCCDVTSVEALEGVREQLLVQWSHISLIINNAGIATGGKLAEESTQQWQRVLEINLMGVVNGTRVFADVFNKQRGGQILNVSSQAALSPIPSMGSYAASKAAVLAFSEVMHFELSPLNIDVSVLCPSFFQTNLVNSMQSDNTQLKNSINRLMKKSPLSAQQVADIACQGVLNKQFLILTHPQGKWVYRIKSWLSAERYLSWMARRINNR